MPPGVNYFKQTSNNYSIKNKKNSCLNKLNNETCKIHNGNQKIGDQKDSKG